MFPPDFDILTPVVVVVALACVLCWALGLAVGLAIC